MAESPVIEAAMRAVVVEDVAKQFCQGVRNARRAPADFPAFHFQPFGAATVDTMVASLPPLSAYQPIYHPDAMVDNQPTRYALRLNQKATVAEFWLAVAEAMKSEPVRYHIASALGLDDLTPLYPAVALLRDFPGYNIRVHPDSRRKIATAQIYLASHAGAQHIGVRFYRQAGAEFTETAAVPYLPGSGYFFRRSDASWHGVNPTAEADGVRDSLMLVYFDRPNNGFS